MGSLQGQFAIDQASYATLNKVAEVLKANPNMKLDIISHTDALGNDETNMTLSQKRAQAVVDYFVSKGIDKNRMKATGKGETEIRNRCTNGVNCSDKEHEYNRRTELRFSK